MDYLPIFIKLDQQPCWVVGGGVVAARKADLLIKSGANVTVISPELAQEMQRFLDQGQVGWICAEFSNGIADKLLQSNGRPKLIISATDDETVNQAVADYAHERDILVNVADVTELCDFILPAIVDRDPVTIAVSTGGRSPVLARVIKARLESMIPAGFGRLADLLGRYRDRVKGSISTVDGRKRFWEKLLSGHFVDQATTGRIKEAEQTLNASLKTASQEGSDANHSEVGAVYIIGAGPGDPDLMTFKALRLLQEADVVLYDRLVAPEIVEMARREAERVYVGKKDRHHAVPQDEINQMMVRYAQQGKKVARLKGGDPYIFGRGAEEAEVLVQEGVPFEVVPGITAAAGCSAYAGFPLTHREFSQSVTFVTGHQQAGASKVDYARLANAGDTMVFYMGIKNVAQIQRGLLSEGMSEKMPAAIVQRGTRPDQKVTYTTLGDLSETVAREGIKPPALLFVGEVIQIAERLKPGQGEGVNDGV
jgi:uroporphyrin-III C-methyltransferase/precorrin-2 dehydrogenase/sirohydrochlorin ferrochelatase